jgi:Sulfotransferase family
MFRAEAMGFSRQEFRPQFPDSKAIHRALFGVFYEEDLFDKFCGSMPRAMRLFGWRLDETVRRHNLIFIHVPRVAGTSIAHSLYGPRCTRHYSIRYFKTVAPKFWANADSFALLRDPFDRFASAYAFVRSGGTETCRLADVFVRQTANLRGVDDYLSFIEDRDALSLDFVMRPQSWFVCDLETGESLVKRLFLYGQDGEALAAFLKQHDVGRLPWLNPSERIPLFLSARQRKRIEKIYARDFELVEGLRRQRAQEVSNLMRIAGIAAE